MKKLLSLFGLLLIMIIPAQGKMKDYKEIMKSRSIYEIDAFLRDAHPDDPRRSVLKPRLMDLIKEYLKTAHPADQQVKTLQEKLATLKRRPSTKIDFVELRAEWKKKQIERYQAELAANQRGDFKPYVAPKESEEEKAKPSVAQTIAKDMSAGRKAATTSFSRTGMNKDEQGEFDLLMNMSSSEHKQKTVKILNALFDNDPTSPETTVLIENKSDCNIIVRIEGAGNMKYRLPVPAKEQNTIVVKKGDYLFSSVVCNAQYASQKTVKGSIMVSLNNPK